MKKLILLLSFFLISFLGFSQATPTEILRIADATTAMGKNLSVGKIVYNIATDELFVVNTGVASTLTLTTGTASFTLINPEDANTNLSEGTATTTTVDVNSSTGTNATIAAASTSRAGVMSKAKFDEVEANNAKVTNVSTSLSTGTVNATTYGITSDGSTDDVVLAEADTDNAGLLGAAKWDEIVANTNKVTNVSTDLSLGTRAATTMDVNSSDGSNVTLLAASTTEAGLMTDAQFDKLAAIEASADVNFTLFSEKFEEDSATPTAHSLAHTAQTGGATVALNGSVLNPTDYTFTSTNITITIPVLQYDIVTITYNY